MPVACLVGVGDRRSLDQEIPVLGLEDLRDPCAEVGNRPCRTLAQEDHQVLDEACRALVEAVRRVVRVRDLVLDNRVRVRWEVVRRTLEEDDLLEVDRQDQALDHLDLLNGIVAEGADRQEAFDRLGLQNQGAGEVRH